MKKIINGILCAVVALSCALPSCKGKGEKTELTADKVKVWATSATEKVLLDQPVENYEDKVVDGIALSMAKNEYESGQIIISPEVDVETYKVTVGEIKLDGGAATIAADDIEVYVEKYLIVNNNFEGNGAPLGRYPDALVPYDAIVEYGENNVKADTNQGLYVTFKTSKEQPAGIYRGEVTVDFGNFNRKIPVAIAVKDVTVSDENHRQDVYVAGNVYEHGELNSTQAMRDAYIQACIDYRVATGSYMVETTYSLDDAKRWAEKCYHYLSTTSCSTIGVPYKIVTLSLVYDDNKPEKTFECFDPDTFKMYIAVLAEMSVEKELDMFEYAVFYNAIIDEGIDRGVTDQSIANIRLFAKTIVEAADDFAEKYEVNAESGEILENPTTLEERIYNNIRTLQDVFTAYYYPSFSAYDEFITYVPLANGMDSPTQREQYAHQKNKWWYYCNNPSYPYVSVHVDNTTTFSARMMGWMQADYDIKGTLYWCVNMYTETDLTKTAVALEDYFEGSAQRTYHLATGEGWLFYPGGQYGLKEPIPSIRMMALRDGYEEYELIYALKQQYKANDFNADELVSSLGSQLYSGTKVSATTADFLSARESLLSLCEVASSSAGMSIIGSRDDGNGNVIYEIFSKAELSSDGVKLDGVTSGDGKIYTVTKRLSGNDNKLNISFTADGKNYTYTQSLGGKVEVYGAEELSKKITFGKDSASVDRTELTEYNGAAAVRVDVLGTQGAYQIFRMNSDIFKAMNSSTSKMVLTIINPTDEDIKFYVYAKYKNDKVAFALIDTALKPGENIVEISVAYTNWSKKGSIEYLRPRFGEGKDENPDRTVYITRLAVYDK